MSDKNLEYIRRGKTGCVFATILSRDPLKVGWVRIFNPSEIVIPEEALIVSYIFEGKDKSEVISWALSQGMYMEETSDGTLGLRYAGINGVSWVQYFGPESHVVTRQSPESELLFCVKLPKKYYWRVGFTGVLHLAHGSVEHIKEKALDIIWEGCFKRTRKLLGYKPTIKEAAKTTILKEEEK